MYLIFPHYTHTHTHRFLLRAKIVGMNGETADNVANVGVGVGVCVCVFVLSGRGEGVKRGYRVTVERGERWMWREREERESASVFNSVLPSVETMRRYHD
jgi:hypothetical protein